MEIGTGPLVVGIDGSEASREALRWGSRLAGVMDTDLVVSHAVGLLEDLDGRPVPAYPRRFEIGRVIEREWCAGLRLTGTPFRLVLRQGDPVDVLVDVAREERACLLVVGSRGVGTAPALALGSTSLHVVQLAPVPVLVVPGREDASRHLGLRRILVWIDGATPPGAAVGLSCFLAGALGATVELVNAVEEVPMFPLAPATAVSVAGEPGAPGARARLEQLCQRYRRQGVPAHAHVRRGRPEEVLRSTAADIAPTWWS